MATIVWTGNSKTVAQVTTITISGSVAGSEVITVTVNGKATSYTTTIGETTAQIATAIYALLILVLEPEYREISFSNDTASVITCTAVTPGMPFTITTGVVGGTVVSTAATPTASTGPNDLSSVKNYAGGALPVNSDSFVKPPDTPDIFYGLTAFSGITLAAVELLGGSIGLPDQNPSGYTEYRTTSMILGTATSLNIGDGKDAPSYCRIRIDGSGSCPVKIDTGRGLGADVNNPTTLITTGGTEVLVVSVESGSVGFALAVGEVALLTSIKVGTGGPAGSIGASDEESAASWGTGATVTACTLYAGEIRAGATTALTMEGGTYTVFTGNIGAVTNKGGTLVFNSAGTMGACTFFGPDSVLDMSADNRAVSSITSLSVTGGARFFDPQKRLGNVVVVTDRVSAPLCDWGVSMTLTRS